jgi:Sigma-70, region 4
MIFSFPKLIFQAVNKKLLALYKDNSNSRGQSLAHAKELEAVKQKLISLKDANSDDFFTYSNYNTYQKSIFRDTAKMICTYSAISIHNRCLELGFDNYDRSIFDLGATQLMDKLKEFNLTVLSEQMEKLKIADEVKDHMAKSFGFKPHPFSLNQEVVSAIFRADPIIGEECEIMMLTIYSFIQKKAYQFGLKNPIERSGLDYSDFFNVSSIGYLNATLYWNPKASTSKSGFKKHKNKKVFSAQFPSYGWTFAMGQITLLIYSRRMVRFPNHLEEAINRIHRNFRKRKLEIMAIEPYLSDYQIDQIIAQEMKEDVQVIQNIFSVFVSPNSALTSLLPSEQRILNLHAKQGDTELELIDIVQDPHSIDPAISIDHDFMSQDLYKQLEILTVQKRVVLLLRFGLKIKPKEWQDSGFKGFSKIDWKNIPEGAQTLRQVGDLIGLGLERIRQIEAESFRKLRGHTQTKSVLRQHFNRDEFTPRITHEENSEESKLYQTQMYNLDLIKFNKICNHNHAVPKSMYDAINLFDSLRLLKPMTVRQAIDTLINKLYYYFNGSRYFRYTKEVPTRLWEAVLGSNYQPRYFNLEQRATFKEIDYHFTQITQYLLQNSCLSLNEQKDIVEIYNYLNKNPIFLVNLL